LRYIPDVFGALDGAGIGLDGSRTDLQQRRLPGSVGADDRHRFAVPHLERDVVQNLTSPVALGDPIESERRRALLGDSER
jgi:hypothetical protein